MTGWKLNINTWWVHFGDMTRSHVSCKWDVTNGHIWGTYWDYILDVNRMFLLSRRWAKCLKACNVLSMFPLKSSYPRPQCIPVATPWWLGMLSKMDQAGIEPVTIVLPRWVADAADVTEFPSCWVAKFPRFWFVFRSIVPMCPLPSRRLLLLLSSPTLCFCWCSVSASHVTLSCDCGNFCFSI